MYPSFEKLFPGVTTATGTTLLGGPVGPSEEYRSDFILGKKKEIIDFIKEIAKIPDVYVQYQLLKHCTISWARYITSVLPAKRLDTVMREYISDIDEAVLRQIGRILGMPVEQLQGTTLAMIALPTRNGGLGIQRLTTTAPISYLGSINRSIPALKTHSPLIARHIQQSIKDKDQFDIHATYQRVKEHADWHDHPLNTNAPFRMPNSTAAGIKNPEASAEMFSKNLHSRTRQTLTRILIERTKTTNAAEAVLAKRNLARFRSAGGKMASRFLELIPKQSRFERRPLLMPPHLFSIALRLRMGVDLDSTNGNGGRCICREKTRGQEGPSVMDRKGFHLTACKWGAWNQERHDKVAEEICNWMKAAGCDATTNQYQCAGALPKYRGKRKIADILVTDQRNAQTVYDVMITRVDQQAHEPLFAATAGEKTKMNSYNTHKNKCTADGDTSLATYIRCDPLVFEAPAGAAGRTMIALAGRISNHHRAFVLPRDIRKDTSIFQATWINRISTAVQLGTANMIYHISRMSRTSGRICKEQYSETLNNLNLPMGPRPNDTSGAEHQDEHQGTSESESGSEVESETSTDEPTRVASTPVGTDANTQEHANTNHTPAGTSGCSWWPRCCCTSRAAKRGYTRRPRPAPKSGRKTAGISPHFISTPTAAKQKKNRAYSMR